MNDHAREVRNALVDPAKLCTALDLSKGAKRQYAGVLICCPVHGERNPSCSVSLGRDGTIRVRCFACDFSGDALTLIANVRGENLRDRDGFRNVLAEGAEIAGLLALEAEIRDGRARPDRQRVPPPPPRDEVEYPEQSEIIDLWRRAMLPGDDADACRYLVGRKIDPDNVGARGLARVLVGPLPQWARYRGRSWIETGHRLFVRCFDVRGHWFGVRSIQILNSDPPKRLPPAGRRAAELVLANGAAYDMLVGKSRPARIVIAEGEPDWLTHADDQPNEVAVIGITSGSWTAAFAERLPRGAEVMIRTHADEQGERYAAKIAESIGERCETWRAA
jgi:hypothetical protein